MRGALDINLLLKQRGLHIPSRGFTAVRDKTFLKNLIYISGEATHFQRLEKNAEK
jgi:hypothetical protein